MKPYTDNRVTCWGTYHIYDYAPGFIAGWGAHPLWAWGDEQRRMTPKRWGINGKVDRRLQRYICARLGPLPGWSIAFASIQCAGEEEVRVRILKDRNVVLIDSPNSVTVEKRC